MRSAPLQSSVGRTTDHIVPIAHEHLQEPHPLCISSTRNLIQRSQGISQCRTRIRKPVLPGTIPWFECEIFRNQVGRQSNKIEFCPHACLSLPHTLDECDDQLVGKWPLGAIIVKSMQFSKEL